MRLPTSRERTIFAFLTWIGFLYADPASITPSSLPLSYIHDFVWDSTHSRLVVSTGSSIVIINPDSNQVEDTIESGQTAGKLAVSSDGQYLYAAIGSRGVIQRYRMRDHSVDLEIPLGKNAQGTFLTASAMIVLPGTPQSLIVARGVFPGDDYFFGLAAQDVSIYDGSTPRKTIASINAEALYARASDGTIFGWGPGNVYQFAISGDGVTTASTWPVPATFAQNQLPNWNGSLLMDRAGTVFSVDKGTLLGQVGPATGCALTTDSSGTSVFGAAYTNDPITGPGSLEQYSLATFQQVAASPVSPATDFNAACDVVSAVKAWGTDGIAIDSYQHSGGGSVLVLLHSTGLAPITLNPPPNAQLSASGVIQLVLPVNDLVYDASRNRIWASVGPNQGQIGNSIVSIDPSSGTISGAIQGVSSPSILALSNDASYLFAISQSALTVNRLDLNANQLTQSFSLPGGNHPAPIALAPSPDQNNSVVVVSTLNDIAYTGTISVFDNGVARTNSYNNIDPKFLLADDTLPWVTAIYPGDAQNAFYGADLSLQSGSGTRDLGRFVVDGDGISLDHTLTPQSLGDTSHFGIRTSNLKYDNGRLFTSAGQVWTPDLQVLQGTFSIQQSYASSGLPIPLSDRNQIAYVYQSGLTFSAGITVFDLGTLRPVSTIPLLSPSNNTLPQILTAVRAGDSIAVAFNGQIAIVPLSALQPWPQPIGASQTLALGVKQLDLSANAIAGVPGGSKLVLATPSSAGNLGNSIVTYDPSTAKVSSVFAGSEPTLLSLAPDGSGAYTTLAGERRVARVNIGSQSRDLVFPPDPNGGSNQYDIFDMAIDADGGLALSYYGGAIALFDNGVPRPVVDWNIQGTSAYTPATFKIALNDTGNRLYAFNTYLSTFDFKRCNVSPQGINWLSNAQNLISGGYSAQFWSAGGLLYTTRGDVVDPERSRVVGSLSLPQYSSASSIVPDPSTGRVFVAVGQTIMMFDINSRSLLGSLQLPLNYTVTVSNLVRFGDDGLAMISSQGQRVVLVSISAIPLLPQPLPSPQPSLPVTPGVTVVDLASQDIVYDPSRNLIYSSVPNSEAANGDQIAAIDAGSGSIVNTWPAMTNPSLLALPDGQSILYFTAGAVNIPLLSGFSTSSEVIGTVDLNAGAVGSSFPSRPSSTDTWYTIPDLVAIPGPSSSVAAIDDLFEGGSLDDGSGATFNLGLDSLRIYDSGSSRSTFLGPHTFTCTFLTPDSTGSRLYCSSGANVVRLQADDSGVSILDSFPLIPGRGVFGHMAYGGGRLYTTTGLVIDPEGKKVITRLATQGAVATDGNAIYWLDQSGFTTAAPSVILRSFDASTFQPTGTMQINVTSNDLTRLVTCGSGCLAFRAGHEVYIVRH